MSSKTKKIQFALGVLGVAILHFIGSFMLQFIAGTTGGDGVKLAATISTFPLSLYQGPDDVSPLVFWVAWGLLSLGWGFAFCLFVRLFADLVK